MGLTAPGQGARAVLEGWTAKDGRLPVNPSGGLKAKGHPIGATGVSMHAITAMQLTGQAGAHAVAEGGHRRRVQHGRRRGGELRVDPGAGCADPDQQPRASAVADRAAVSRPAGDDLARARPGPGRSLPPGSRRRPARWRRAACSTATACCCTRATPTPCWRRCSPSWMLGAVWVPTNFRLTPPEVAYLAQSSGAAVHIFDAAFPDHAAAAKAENPACRLEISIGAGELAWDALATARHAGRPRRRMSSAIIRRGSSTPPAPPAGRRRAC